MATKITVNGIRYDNVDAMPADVRRTYEQAMAKLPDLADRDGDGIPDIVEGADHRPRVGTTVRKFVVNGTTYESEEAMPPDVRAAYERAKAMLGSGKAQVRTNEVKLSFQLTGPGLKFGRSVGRTTSSPLTSPVTEPLSGGPSVPGLPSARPIEPSSAGGGVRLALVLGACAAAGLMLWLFTRAR